MQVYHFRAPDKQTFIEDIKAVLAGEGIDPYEVQVVEKRVLSEGESETEVLGPGISVVEAGRWWETPPTADEGGSASGGTLGDYALINAATSNETLQSIVAQFATSDPAKDPAEIPGEEKIGAGTHRIAAPATPVREFAT